MQTAAASLQTVQREATTADQAKADAHNAVHSAQTADAAAVGAEGAADKAAAAASDALAAAFGEALTMSKVGKSTSEGSVQVTDANYSVFQDAVASAQSANSSASTVAQIRQNAIDSYNEADQDTQNAFNAAKHIQVDAGAVIDAKNAAARAARRAADAAAAANAAADGCRPKPEPPQTPPPPPPAQARLSELPELQPSRDLRALPGGGRGVEPRRRRLQRAAPRPQWHGEPRQGRRPREGPRPLRRPHRVRAAMRIAPAAQSSTGSPQEGSVLSGSVLQGVGVPTPTTQQPNRGAEDPNSRGSAASASKREPGPGRQNAALKAARGPSRLRFWPARWAHDAAGRRTLPVIGKDQQWDHEPLSGGGRAL